MKKKVFVLKLFISMLLLSLLFINSINLVNALTTIEKQPEKTYNLGDKIDLSIFVNLDIEPEKQVFVNADLHCNNYNLNFFKTPYTHNFIQLPSLTIDNNFLGNCKVIISILDLNNNKLEKVETNEFIITNTLALDFSIDKEIYSPGDNILISGKLKKGVEIKIELKDLDKKLNFYQENLTTDILSITLPLNENISKGEKTIFIYAQDKHGNKAEDSKKIQVLQVPKTLTLELEKNTINPKEDITFISYVLDQSGEKMNLEINYRIINPENNVIESIKSNQSVIKNLQNPAPGDYIVKALYKNLEDVKKFSVSELKEIALEVKNGIITIINTGNVKYIDDMTINATIDNVVYQIPISLSLRVNEKTLIDLKNELPSENYALSIYSQNETYSLDNVNVEDNRPLIKKMSQGISKVTGSTIISTEKINNVFYLGFLLVFIGFIVTVITYRRFKHKITGIVDDTVIVQKQKIGGLYQSLEKGQKERNILKNMFGSYIDSNILKKDFKPEIRNKEISILFTDIRGFAKIFDTKDSNKITDILNMYFSKSSYIIKRNNGFVNKFIGDSVMALFNALTNDNNHLINSIKSAIEIKKEMRVLNEKLKSSSLEPIKVGIGIDSGFCSIGLIGSKEKQEFTAIGIPVNIAFRLQSISNGEILITENVYAKLKDRIKADYFGEFEMKNIKEKIKVYKVFGIN